MSKWRYLDIGTVEDEDGTVIAECVDAQHGELLAAAPKMLAALRWYVDAEHAADAHDQTIDLRTFSHMARAAIAKATGAA